MAEIDFTIEPWELKAPFRITGYEITTLDLFHVSIRADGSCGRGEATGIYYLDETGQSMLEQAEGIRRELEQGINRADLQLLLPPGGARNAIDCALWDLETRQSGRSVWELTGIVPRTTSTAFTIGIASPEKMARQAGSLRSRLIKVKLDEELPLERMLAIRAARPDAELIVDVNGGWTFEQLVEFAPKMRDLGVAVIEQPLPRGEDEALEDYQPPLTLCADESCLNLSEFDQATRRYQMINIKLDKTGGLTEALELVALAVSREMDLMVGNMIGTSLAMAPAYVVAQLCDYVDLDGAMFLKGDRDHPMELTGGCISAPGPGLWGFGGV